MRRPGRSRTGSAGEKNSGGTAEKHPGDADAPPGFFFGPGQFQVVPRWQRGRLNHILKYSLTERRRICMGIVVVRSPKCLRGLLRRLFGVKG